MCIHARRLTYILPVVTAHTHIQYNTIGYMARYKQSLAQTAVAEYCKIANDVGMTPAELALAW